MLSYASAIALNAEREAAQGGSAEQVLEILRKLPLDDFAEFLLRSPQADRLWFSLGER
jgi:hypothetical protein